MFWSLSLNYCTDYFRTKIWLSLDISKTWWHIHFQHHWFGTQIFCYCLPYSHKKSKWIILTPEQYSGLTKKTPIRSIFLIAKGENSSGIALVCFWLMQPTSYSIYNWIISQLISIPIVCNFCSWQKFLLFSFLASAIICVPCIYFRRYSNLGQQVLLFLFIKVNNHLINF